jgi:hypothetical protein
MICQSCNQESLPGSFCSACGTPISRPAGTFSGDPFPQSLPTSAAERAKSALRVPFTLVLWAAIAIMGYVKTLRWCGGNFNPEASGYLVGTILTPTLVALLVVWLIDRGRREKGPEEHRYVVVACLAFLISFLSLLGSLKESGPSNASIQDQTRHLVMQATGKEAEVNTNWYDEPAREFYRDIVAFNQEYLQAVRSVDRTPVGNLYKPESYATKGAMQNTLGCLQALQEIDKRYESMETPVKKFDERINASGGSDRQKQDFLKGVHSSFEKKIVPRGETFRVEEEWLQSSIDLYQFTLDHFSDYSVRKHKLIFRSGASLEEFNKLQSKSIALHKATREAKSKLESTRQDDLSRVGLTTDDVAPGQKAEK